MKTQEEIEREEELIEKRRRPVSILRPIRDKIQRVFIRQ